MRAEPRRSATSSQRYRVGANYLQLPVNCPKVPVGTNQRDGQMTYVVDTVGENPHVNYEPSILGGLEEADYPTPDEEGPVIEGRLTRARIPRTNDYAQAGERFRLSEEWERDDLVANLVNGLSQCDRPIQERMVWHFFLVEDELGQRVGKGVGVTADDVRDLPPLPTQTLNEEEQQRLKNLGNNGPRDVTGHTMTHCVPNEHVQRA
jgi:catalase